jgi:adenosylcobinamide-GDP ribazoletransferase
MQAVSAELRGLAGAVAFLTRVPIGRWIALDAADVARGGAVFPLVGAGIGAVVGGIADALDTTLTPTLAAVCGVGAGAVLTGALHLDGLADTFDALGATTRERALEIMRDHRIGTYGAVALVVDLVAKVAALSALAARGDALPFAVCAAASARVVPVLLAAALPYARPGEGLGRVLGGWSRAPVALAVAFGFCAWLGGLVLLAVALGVAIVAYLLLRAWLGGTTGDTLGAAAETAELAALIAAVALT